MKDLDVRNFKNVKGFDENVARIFFSSKNVDSLLSEALGNTRNVFDLLIGATLGVHSTPSGYTTIEKLAEDMEDKEALKIEIIVAYAFEGRLELATRNFKAFADITEINKLLKEVWTRYSKIQTRLSKLDRTELQDMAAFVAQRRHSLGWFAKKITFLENDFSRLSALFICRGVFEEELALFGEVLQTKNLSGAQFLSESTAFNQYLDELEQTALSMTMVRRNIIAIDSAIAAGYRHIKNILTNPNSCNCPRCQMDQVTILESLREKLPMFLKELRDKNVPFPLLSMDRRNHLADICEFLSMASQASEIIDGLNCRMASDAMNELAALIFPGGDGATMQRNGSLWGLEACGRKPHLMRELDAVRARGETVDPLQFESEYSTVRARRDFALFDLSPESRIRGLQFGNRYSNEGECRCDNRQTGLCGSEFDGPDLTAASANASDGRDCKYQRTVPGPIPEEDRAKVIEAAEGLLGFPLDDEEREQFFRTGVLRFKRFIVCDL